MATLPDSKLAAAADADDDKIDCGWTQGEATRRREQELVKLRKDIELLTVQHESSEASLRKRHQEAINELNDQIEQLSKHRNKSVSTRLQQNSVDYTLLTAIEVKIFLTRNIPPPRHVLRVPPSGESVWMNVR